MCLTSRTPTLNIAGDYIAHGIRHRASEILTRELGPQSEQEVELQLDHEAGQDRFTRFDRDLIARIGDNDTIDMRPSEEMATAYDPQRYRLLKRLTKLEGLGLAKEIEPGRWIVYAGIDDTLKELGERSDIIKTMHRTLADQGLERGTERYAIHHEYDRNHVAIGRVIGKGLATDEMSDRVHLVVDGIDGRVHYAEMAGAQAEGVRIGSIVDIGRAVARTRKVDRTIAELAARHHGVYEPVVHKFAAQKMTRIPGGDPAAFVQSHVRRLEALRRSGVVTRLSEDTWKIMPDF